MAIVQEETAALVELAYSDPSETKRRAHIILSNRATTELERCSAWWALGLAARELGQAEEAAERLRTALSLARTVADRHLETRITTTLAWVESQLGRSDAALTLLADVEPFAADVDVAHVLLQRSLILQFREQLGEAVEPIVRATEIFHAHGDIVGEARAHLNLGVLHGQLHQPQLSLTHSELARDLADSVGQELLGVQAQHNVGYSCYQVGDVPRALREMSAAEQRLLRMTDVGALLATVRIDRAQVLMHANLLPEAAAQSERALTEIRSATNALLAAETTLVAAQCRLAEGSIEDARRLADQAVELLEFADRPSWVPLAKLIQLQCDLRLGGRPLVDEAEQLARTLVAGRWTNEAIQASLMAADLLVRGGEPARAEDLLAACSKSGPGTSALERSGIWLVRARRHELRGEMPSARRAVTRGLGHLRSNLVAVGALELRANAQSQGLALAEIGVRLAVTDGRPREVLRRLEELRGGLALTPRVRPDPDDETADLLAQFRGFTLEIRSAAASGVSSRKSLEARASVEARLRERSFMVESADGLDELSPAEALQSMGDARLIEFAVQDDDRLAIDASRGRCRLRVVSSRDQLDREIDSLHHLLHILNRRGAASKGVASLLREVAEELEAVLLPAHLQRGGRLVIVPDQLLAGVPWGVFPQLFGTAVVVAPSLTSWSIADRRRRDGRLTVGIAGPDLAAADAELASLSNVVQVSAMFTSGRSKIESVLPALERADVAHFACHGAFRQDSPLFSSLRLADGELTVYDLEQCERLPHTIVLSACNAGQSAALHGGALLGIASALIQLGVSSVIAPLTPVNDERSVDLMVRLHTHLAAGVPAAEALAKASILPDGALDPTAAPFICFGS